MMNILTRLIIFAGFFGVQQFGFTQQLADMPTPRSGTCAVVFDEQIYVMGGRDQDDEVTSIVERYNPATDSWIVEPEGLEEERENAAAVVFQGKMFILGGRDDEGEILKKVEFYDPVKQEWEEFEHLDYRREGLSAVVLDQKIYAIGGFGSKEDNHEAGQFLDVVEYYDQNSDKWLVDSNWLLDFARASFATVVVSGSAFTIGGFSNFGPLGGVESYDPVSGQSTWDNLNIARGGFAGTFAKERIYVMGGRNQSDQVIDEIEFFSPDSNFWEFAPPLKTTRELFSAVTVEDTIYVIGGRDDGGNVLSSVEKVVPEDFPDSVDYPFSEILFEFSLEQNYPNPFNPETQINFRVVNEPQLNVRLSIYNVQGQLVNTLINKELRPGTYAVKWDGTSAKSQAVTSGVYIYTLQQGELKETKKMLLVR